MSQNCELCGCQLHRGRGTYAEASVEGRSHATEHHYVADRLYGKKANGKVTKHTPVFEAGDWPEGDAFPTGTFCYECHEELLHNPVLLRDDIAEFAELVQSRGLGEDQKPEGREQLAGRVRLLHECIRVGIAALRAVEGLPFETAAKPGTRRETPARR